VKFCNHCNSQYNADDFICSKCSSAALVEDGIVIHAPDMAYEGGGFNPEAFENLAKLEEKSFWFRSRNQLIIWLMQRIVLKNQQGQSLGKYLEIGCGTGYVLKGVKTAFNNTDTFGSEIFLSGLEQAKGRLDDINLMQMDARAIPYQDEFDVIGAFDVLEHIKEDEKVISEVYRALNSGGFFIATVPQHDWLWSKVDDYACHQRRYKPNELQDKMKVAGFKIVETTSFVSLLVPLMYVSRSQKRDSRTEFNPSDELALNPVLNFILYTVMKLELGLIKLGIRFSIGGSRLVIGKKQ
jgi:SAM-dependent methyltransferase|tara:strand:- start:7183 stop:8070 length:888 start_codon:yes stop_codon:yes gene_type:complete